MQRLNSLPDGLDNFLWSCNLNRVFSLSVIALTSPLSFSFARWFTTADNSVFTFVSIVSRSRGRFPDPSLLPSNVQLLVGLVIGYHVVLRLDDRHVPVAGRHWLGRLVQHLVVRCPVWSSLAPLPCLSEDLSFVTFQCSVIVRDFALWGVDRATAPVYRVPWVSLPGPTEVMTMPG